MPAEPIYQHPLAYLLAMEGLALLRGWAGDFDEAFVRDRLAEVRRLLDDPVLGAHPGVRAARGSAHRGYEQKAPSYDGPNRLFDLDGPFVEDVLDQVPSGAALDAACGTGRFSEVLARRGFDVVGVDSSPQMLHVAQRRVPGARFVRGDLRQLPLPDASVDVVVCALALSHLPRLEPVMAEFARVLTPGGNLVISDVHHELVVRGSVIHSLGPDGQPGLVPTFRHTPGAFLRAALGAGLAVRGCEELAPAHQGDTAGDGPTAVQDGVGSSPVLDPGPWADWPWSLMDLAPAATSAAWDVPLVIAWHFRREDAALR